MKFTINRKKLLDGLQVCSLLTGGGKKLFNKISFFSLVLFRFNEDGLKLTAWNPEMAVNYNIKDIDPDKARGSFLCDPEILVKILKEGRDELMALIITEQYLKIYIDRAEFKIKIDSFQTREYLNYIPVFCNPTTPRKIPSNILINNYNAWDKFSSQDDLIPQMSYIELEKQERQWNATVTNANILFNIQWKDQDKTNTREAFYLPGTLMKRHLTRDRLFSIFNSKLMDVKSKVIWTTLVTEDMELHIRNDEGKYPAWKSVIPEPYPNHINLNKDGLIQAIRQISTVSPSYTHQCILDVDPGRFDLRVTANDLDIDALGNVNVRAEINGKAVKIGMNVKFLLDALKEIPGEKVRIEYSARPNQAVILRDLVDEDVMILVMPILID